MTHILLVLKAIQEFDFVMQDSVIDRISEIIRVIAHN